MIEQIKRLWAGKRKDDVVEELVEDKTAGHRPPVAQRAYYGYESRDLPIFRYQTGELMLFDPVVSFGMNVRDAALSAAEIEIDCDDATAKIWLKKQWETIWGLNGEKLLRTKRFGFGGFQVLYDHDSSANELNVGGLREFSPLDIRHLHVKGTTVGVKLIRSLSKSVPKPTDILAPKGLWTTFDAEYGSSYGKPILKRSYSPWFEKWMDGGQQKVKQLRMMKDAYSGIRAKYPENPVILGADSTKQTARDKMREVIEHMWTGNTTLIPSDMWPETNTPKYEISDPVDTGDPVAIWKWGEDCDQKIWMGMDVPNEIIQAAAPGSGFSGRSIPFVVFLSIADREFRELVRAVVDQVLRPLAWLQFGNDLKFTVKPIPIVDSFASRLEGSAMGGGAIGGIGTTPQSQQQMTPSQQQGFPRAAQFSEAGPPDSTNNAVEEIVNIGGKKARAKIAAAAAEIDRRLKKKRLT